MWARVSATQPYAVICQKWKTDSGEQQGRRVPLNNAVVICENGFRLAQAATDSALLEHCDQSFIDVWWDLTKGLAGAKMEDWGDAVAIRSSIPAEIANTLFVMKQPANAEELVEKARRFYSGPRPWRIVANGKSKQSIASAVGTSMTPGAGSPGMLLVPVPVAFPPPPPSLRIEQVSNEEQLSEYWKVAAKAFGMPMVMTKLIIPRVPAATDSAVLLLGYEGGEPVASGAVISTEGIAGIYTIGVMPKSRKRGYGEAITWAAVKAGRERGCKVSYLQASKMGLPIYERMGFKVTAEYPEWFSKVSVLNKVGAFLYFVGMTIRGA